MSYIPDCRSDETYNEKYLIGSDDSFVAGFDWCTESGIKKFAENIDIYDDSDFDADDALSDIKANGLTAENIIGALSACKEAKDKVINAILHYIGMERDELITSLIDNFSANNPEYSKMLQNESGCCEENVFEEHKRRVDEQIENGYENTTTYMQHHAYETH